MYKFLDGRTASQTCWAEVNHKALTDNFRLVSGMVSEGTEILPIVKANAYGHGAIEISKTLVQAGANVLGVATVEEGRELREAGIRQRILVLGRIVPPELAAALRWDLEIAIPHIEIARHLGSMAASSGKIARIHLKVDTGMTRLGVPWSEAPAALVEIRSTEGLELVGVFSHFANADLADEEFTREQIQRFEGVRNSPEASGLSAGIFHLANSAAILTSNYPENTGVRPGIMLYGSPPSASISGNGIKPVLSWKCRVLQVREVPKGTGVSYGQVFVTKRKSRIATIAVGYADGYSRCLTNKGRVLIRGRKLPIIGRVCMDLSMVDITDTADVQVGDEVILIGRQDGVSMHAQELADLAGTISYEIFCGISSRISRIHRNGP